MHGYDLRAEQYNSSTNDKIAHVVTEAHLPVRFYRRGNRSRVIREPTITWQLAE
jgi:hypothetical protein